MSSLVWQSWPRITFKESQKLLQFFASKDEVITFRSTRRYLLGAVGQGLVVFKGPETAKSLLGGANEASIDLMHVFEPSSTKDPNSETDSSTTSTTSSSQEAQGGTTVVKKNAASGDWRISLRDLERTPNQIFIDHISRGEIDSARKAELQLDDYRKQVLARLSSYNPDVNAFLREKFVEQVDAVGCSVKERRQRRYSVKKQDLEKKRTQDLLRTQNTAEIETSDVQHQQGGEKTEQIST